MSCPNCNDKLEKETVDDQSVLHCSNCGGTFFEENGINRISVDSAIALASQERENMISGAPKFCPRDQSALSPATEDSIPQNVLLLRCLRCFGIFAYPDDLVNFKRAQDAKINYFKLWEKPIPSIRAVLVLSVIFVFSLSFYLGSVILKQGSTPTQARDIVQNLSIFPSGRNVLISFRTQTKLISEIILIDKTDGTTIKKDVSREPANFHLITLTGLEPDHQIFFKITVTDDRGRKVETDKRKLNF